MTQATEQQAARKRFSFGAVWSKAVIAGTVKDHDKLVAHGVKLKVGSKSSLKTLKFETLLGKVADALKNAEPAETAAAKSKKTDEASA